MTVQPNYIGILLGDFKVEKSKNETWNLKQEVKDFLLPRFSEHVIRIFYYAESSTEATRRILMPRPRKQKTERARVVLARGGVLLLSIIPCIFLISL